MKSSFIRTFHKCGITLTYRILNRLSEETITKVWVLDTEKKESWEIEKTEPEEWDICYGNNTNFNKIKIPENHKGIILIRDPRDIIISGMHYHLKCSEPWVTTPNPYFNGLSFQECLINEKTDEDRYIFELNRMVKNTVNGILNTIEKFPTFKIIKYEDLVGDNSIDETTKMLMYLGVPEYNTNKIKSIVESLSISNNKTDPHIRNGKPEQWKTDLPIRVLARFEKMFPKVIKKLGYPSSFKHKKFKKS
jgi:Txe/YoeB family toxin of Txe-Axe toxin-antitoxin module